MTKFDEDGLHPVDDPNAELFAECETEEDVLQLMEDLGERPEHCSACGSTAPHHLAYVKAHGVCVA